MCNQGVPKQREKAIQQNVLSKVKSGMMKPQVKTIPQKCLMFANQALRATHSYFTV